MSKEYLVLRRETLVDIADAIRLKTGSSDSIAIDDLNEAVESIQPSGTLVVTENGEYDVSNYAKVIVNIVEKVVKKLKIAKSGMYNYRIGKYNEGFTNYETDRISYVDLTTSMQEIEMETGYIYTLTDANYDPYVKSVYVNGAYGCGDYYDKEWSLFVGGSSYTTDGCILMKADGTINPAFTENGEHTIYMTFD